MKVLFLFLSLIVDVPDWYNEIDQIVQEIDSNSTFIGQREITISNKVSENIYCYSYKTNYKTKVILSDSSTSTNMMLEYYSNKKKAFAYTLQMDTQYYTKGKHNEGDLNRYYEESIIYFKSKNEAFKLKQSFYYNNQISSDSLNNLKNTNEFKNRDVERKEIKKIIKKIRSLKYKCY